MSNKQLHSGWLKTRTDEKFAPNTLTDNIYTAQGQSIQDIVKFSGENNNSLFIIDDQDRVILKVDEDGLTTTNGHFTDDVVIDEDLQVANIFVDNNIVTQGDIGANDISVNNITASGHETLGGNLSVVGDLNVSSNASITGTLEVNDITTLHNGINLPAADSFYITDGDPEQNVIAYVDATGIHAEAFHGSGENITLNDKNKAVVTDGNNKLHAEDLSTTNPTASGFETAFIDSISQNEIGKISTTKKTIQDGTTSQKGIVQLTNSYNETNETLAATGKSIAAAITGLNATGLIETAINALDVPEVGGSTTYIAAISETDGKITATPSNATVGGIKRPIYINNGTFTPVTLDADKILYYNNDSLKGSTSYVSDTKVAINSTQEPNENLYVNGNIGFEEGLISKQGDGFYITDGRNDQYVAFGITSDGTPIAPTAAPGTNDTQIATTAFVTAAVAAGFIANDAMVFKGTIGASPATVSSLPSSGYRAGWTYRVVTSGIYAGQYCEPGDLIIAVGFTPANSDWTIVQNNVDGAVYVGQPGGAVGSTTRPVYVDANGKVTAITGALGNDITGNAATATKAINDSDNNPINTTYIKEVSWDNNNKKITHSKSSTTSDVVQFISGDNITLTAAEGSLTIGHRAEITAKTSYGSISTATNADGGSFIVTDIQYDEAGHITNSTDRTITLSQTKNTAGATDTSNKIYLIGAQTQSDNPQTYTDNELFVQNGFLSTSKLAINSTVEPSNEVLYVNGKAYINDDLIFNEGLIANNRDAFYLIDSADNTIVAIDNSGLKTTAIETQGNITPHNDNTYNLGTNSYKWANIYATTIHGTLNGNASSATAFSANQSITLSGDISGAASSTAGWTITTTIGNEKVTNAMLAGSIANSKLTNSSITIAGNNIALGGSLDGATLLNSLGLNNVTNHAQVTGITYNSTNNKLQQSISGGAATDITTIVTEIKGNAETNYRTGQINLTPANILNTGTSGQFWRGDNTWSSTLNDTLILTNGLNLSNGLTFSDSDRFYITDGSSNQNVIAYFDNNGLTIRKVNIKDENGNDKHLVYYSQYDSSCQIDFS